MHFNHIYSSKHTKSWIMHFNLIYLSKAHEVLNYAFNHIYLSKLTKSWIMHFNQISWYYKHDKEKTIYIIYKLINSYIAMDTYAK